jgi:4-azaleucine resistance transporter AzlC
VSFGREFRAGFLDALPIILAYIPIAMLWGTLAAAKGFSPLEAILMSSLVYGGASQFVAVELWRDPVPVVVMIITALVVNLRHVLMSASISQHLSAIPKRWHGFLMYFLTDEAWAYAERRARAEPLTLGYYVGVAVPLWPTWFIGSGVGAVLGRAFGNPAAVGLDFAFAAMFISRPRGRFCWQVLGRQRWRN